MNSLLVHAEVGDPYFDLEQPWFQSLVVGHHGLVEQQVAAVRSRGVNVYRYINLWTAPLPEWVGRGNPLHDYIDNLVRTSGLYFKDRHGNPARTPNFPDLGSRILINWGLSTPLQRTALVQFILSLDPGGVLWDQVWYRPDFWWFSENGPVFGQMNLLVILLYEIAIRSMANLMQGNRAVILNGDHSIPGDLYLENSQARWQENISLWNSRNIFSVEASHATACQQAVDLWLAKKDRWLAFTAGTSEHKDAAYRLAVNKRSELQGGSSATDIGRTESNSTMP